MTTRTRTVLAANVAPGMRVRRSNHLDWTTIPEAPSACGWPPRLDGLAAVPVPPGERLERHPDCAVADNTAPIGPAFAVQWGEYPHAADSPHAPTPPVLVILCGWIKPPTPGPRAAPRYEVFYTTASIFSQLTEHRSPDIGKALREMASLTPVGNPQALKAVRSVYPPYAAAAVLPGRYLLWIEQPAYADHWGYTGPYPQVLVVQPRGDEHLTTLVKTHPAVGDGGRFPLMVPRGPGSKAALVKAIQDAIGARVYDLTRMDPPAREG